MNMFGIHWGAIEFLYIFLLLIPFIALIAYFVHRKQKIVTFLTSGSKRRLLIKNYSFSRQLIKSFLFIMGLIFLMIAVLRPQWNKKEEKITHEGRDLLVALDISRSMLAKDMNTDRLTFAKQKIRSLVSSLPSDRVGLLLFAGAPCLICPLTSDYDSFFMFLDQIDAHVTSSGGTALDHVIQEGINLFKKIPERKNKLLVIVTDGEDFSPDLTQVKKEAMAIDMHIFALGVGTAEGAPVPLFNLQGKHAGYEKDAKGSVVISRLNEPLLKKLVQETGGFYQHVTENNDDIKAMIEQLALFDKEKIDERKREVYEEKYSYFVAISFICFALEWLL